MRQLVQLMTRLLQHVSATGVPTVILGDFNDNVLCDHKSELQALMLSHGVWFRFVECRLVDSQFVDDFFISVTHSQQQFSLVLAFS